MEKRPIKFGIILILAVSALLFFADVVPVSRLWRATPSSSDKTTPATLSAYYLCVRITNQIYTESLNNQSSKEYKQLRKQVEQMMDDVHSSLPESDKYMGVFDIIFSNGSVIANSTLMFGTTFMIIPTLAKGLLSIHIQSNKSKTLDLDLAYTEGQLPIKATLPLVARTTATVTYSPPSTTNTPAATTNTVALVSTASRSGRVGDGTASTAMISSGNITSLATINITSSHTLTTTATTTSPDQNSTISSITTHIPEDHITTISNITTHIPEEHITTISNITTHIPEEHITTISNITTHIPEDQKTTISNITTPSPGDPNITISNVSTHIPGDHNNTISNTTTPAPEDHNITISNITIPSPGDPNITISNVSTHIPGDHSNTISNTTTPITPKNPPQTSSTTHKTTENAAAVVAGSGEGVPGWGIALLVLAVLTLLILLILLILLLVWLCCRQRYGSFSPYNQINHGADIQMYSTHSRFDVPNGKPNDEMRGPSKNRTGMHVVNEY
ncbi:mucin-1 isoform X1 [Oncorhynchus keta]|uniref:mucin-1 isoform X1 n=2 Tax=Oncorhynchus keta TaxID=8018 RepID=UPI00227CAF65|nr:mucin-1 isoform X1 [Oncorhynchus keta]XP_052345630.1 mucin-1 isoform X1 [Oncorhynchus keta]